MLICAPYAYAEICGRKTTYQVDLGIRVRLAAGDQPEGALVGLGFLTALLRRILVRIVDLFHSQSDSLIATTGTAIDQTTIQRTL